MRQLAERPRDDEQKTLSLRTKSYSFVPATAKRRSVVRCQLADHTALARADGAHDAVVQDESVIPSESAIAVSVEPNVAPHATNEFQYK